jgi:hypothetical protein
MNYSDSVELILLEFDSVQIGNVVLFCLLMLKGTQNILIVFISCRLTCYVADRATYHEYSTKLLAMYKFKLSPFTSKVI